LHHGSNYWQPSSVGKKNGYWCAGGDRGAGPWENRGLEGYGRQERKGGEVGVLREGGEQERSAER